MLVMIDVLVIDVLFFFALRLVLVIGGLGHLFVVRPSSDLGKGNIKKNLILPSVMKNFYATTVALSACLSTYILFYFVS